LYGGREGSFVFGYLGAPSSVDPEGRGGGRPPPLNKKYRECFFAASMYYVLGFV